MSARMDPREIQQLEDLCVQGHAPACAAACPMHVDARAMVGAIAQGDFDKARQIFSQKIPFPGIIARICDHPCQDLCRMGTIIDALQIRDLERACIEYGSPPGNNKKPVPQKNQCIAIAGGGLSGLTAALRLSRMGYRVTVFEAAACLGGRILSLPADTLPSRIIREETGMIEKAGITVHLNSPAAIADLRHDFDAVYYCTGHTHMPDPSLYDHDTGHARIDTVTFSTGMDGVFAGGSLRLPAGGYSPISSVADGHRAAISIDRYFKKVSLAAGRNLEGPYPTRLFTTTEGISPLPAVPMNSPGGQYSRQEAIQEADRCLQCQCLECMKPCAYLKHFDQYPGKCLRSISKNLILEPGFGMRLATKFINACSLCGLCGEVCPTDLDLGAVNLEARRILVDKGYMPEAIHYFPIRDMLFSNSEKCSLSRHAPGMHSSRFVFFPGCQLAASRPDLVEKTYDHLRKHVHEGVGLMLRCCGAPAKWAGRQECFDAQLHDFTTDWEDLGRPVVITACPTCHHMLKTGPAHVPVVSLWELFEKIGLPRHTPGGGSRVLALHDPCAARYETAIQDSVRRLIGQLGYVVEELPLNRNKTQCCGYGGLMYHINREVTGQVITDRISLSEADYVSYCSNCRDFFASRGKPSLHVLDLVFGRRTKDDSLRRGPGYSERQENRMRLKRRLIETLWGEPSGKGGASESVRVIIPPGIQDKMEEQCILQEDVRQVILHAEKTGNKAFNPEDGHFIAHLRPEIITYWVDYTLEADGYHVHNAYSHRLHIIEDETPS